MRCSVANCDNSLEKAKTYGIQVSFHRFPKESRLKAEWIIRCDRKGKWNPDSSFICSDHFVSDDYYAEDAINGTSTQAVGLLRCDAIPSLSLPLALSLPICLIQRLDTEELKEIGITFEMKNDTKLSDLSVDELKSELKKRKIAQVGPKVALSKRLRKALVEEGEDPDTFEFPKESETNSEKGGDSGSDGTASEKSKAVAKNDTKSPNDSTKAAAKPQEEVGTPKRALRRSTRETSPALTTTPAKTPRARARVVTKKLTSVEEESKPADTEEGKKNIKAAKSEENNVKTAKNEEDNSKAAKSEGNSSKAAKSEGNSSKAAKSEGNSNKAAKSEGNSSKTAKSKGKSEENNIKTKGDENNSKTKGEENNSKTKSEENNSKTKSEENNSKAKSEGGISTSNSKSSEDAKKELPKESQSGSKPESKEEEKESVKEKRKSDKGVDEEVKENVISKIDKEATDMTANSDPVDKKDKAEKESKQEVKLKEDSPAPTEEEAKTDDNETSTAKEAEDFDLDLEDMEQPDYEDEVEDILNFDCGSAYISDNDADLEDQSDNKNRSRDKSTSKSPKKDPSSKPAASSASPSKDNHVSNQEGDKDTEEEKEKSKTASVKSSDKTSVSEDSRSLEKGTDEKGESIPRDLWVTGLSHVTKATDLKQAFLKHGKVLSTKIVTNPKMPGSQCFGIVTVATHEDAVTCLKALNVTELLGRFITVKIIAKKDSKKKKDEKTGKEAEKKDSLSSPSKKSIDNSKEAPDDEKTKGEGAGTGIGTPGDKDDKEKSVSSNSENIRARLGPKKQYPGAIRRQRSRTPNQMNKYRENRRIQEMMKWKEIERRKAAMNRRMSEEANRQEAYRLNKEREMLRMERERIEREKTELLRLERERIEREKEEIRKQHMRLEEARRKREFGGGRDDFDMRSKRQMSDRHYSDRRQSPPASYHPGASSGPQPSFRRRDPDRNAKLRKRSSDIVKKKKQNSVAALAGPSSTGAAKKKSTAVSSSEQLRSRSQELRRRREQKEREDLYLKQRKIKELEQIKKLMLMKQKIKKELRMSGEDDVKRRKPRLSRSPPRTASGPSSEVTSSRRRHPHSDTKHRREERPSGRFDSRGDRYGGDRRDGGWRGDGSGWSGGGGDSWSGGNNNSGGGGAHHDNRSWNGNTGRGGRGGYGNGGGGGSRGSNRGGSSYGNNGGPSSMNPYPAPQQQFNPYPPPKY